ncbi:MAG: flavodoxin family protein [Solobacterium sp.]|nr:flavodoxin family protein [Solobacterium sp.]
MYRVLVVNGSPHLTGCTDRALKEVIATLNQEGIETDYICIGNKDIRGCIACGTCSKKGQCVFDDEVNKAAELFEKADGLIIGSPVYYGSPNATAIAFMDRLFYSTGFSKQMKVGAAVVSARRGGNTASFDVLNKYFTISGMPVVSSTYWNQVHGFTAEDVEKDKEGLQVMRNLGRNMAFLIRAIRAEKDKEGLPEVERQYSTHFHQGK